jgi:hypothetical protein
MVERDDGVFFMPFNEFIKHFDSTRFAMLLKKQVPKQQLIFRPKVEKVSEEQNTTKEFIA